MNAIVDKNVKFLNALDIYEKVLINLSSRFDGTNRHWDLIMMVDKHDGSIIELSQHAYVIEDSYTVTVIAKLPIKEESPKIVYELVGLLSGSLPPEIEATIKESFSEYNTH